MRNTGIRQRAFLLAAILLAIPPAGRAADAIERLAVAKLKATRDSVLALREARQPVRLDSGFRDFRAVMHVHSHWSHDSRGSADEIRAAARAAGVQIVLFTEHPADRYDYFADGHRGLHDGVLFVPGAETGGLLVFPTRSLKGEPTRSPQALANLVRRDRGLVFLSHLEERLDWEIAGLTGSEIYNIHADVKDESRFLAMLRSPVALLGLVPALNQYPQEFFAALQDYPASYLKRWDELCQKGRLCGVAANDAHHNTGVRGTIADDHKIVVADALGKALVTLDPAAVPLLAPLVAGKKPGDVVFQVDLDPYERSFRHVSTHLWMNELSQPAVWDALQAGRAYVAFDWMADPTGFAFVAERGARRYVMGDAVRLEAGEPLVLRAAAPLAGRLRVLCNGAVVREATGPAIELAVRESGVYRIEVWLTLGGESRPWILSNPIYVEQ
jgi:hypothetical protein